MASAQPLLVGYGLTQALSNLANLPIIAKRAPTGADKAQIGTLWIDVPTSSAYILVGIVNNVAGWLPVAAQGGAGIFFSVEATGGNITADVGDIIATVGNITAAAGNISTTIGDITSAGNLTATTGDITADAGDIIATLGNIDAPAGTITADGAITSTTGDIVSTAGAMRANVGGFVSTGGDANVASVVITGDTGAPVGGNIQISNVVDTTQGAGALTLVSTTANPGTNTGFFKIYVGVTTCWVPYFDDIAP